MCISIDAVGLRKIVSLSTIKLRSNIEADRYREIDGAVIGGQLEPMLAYLSMAKLKCTVEAVDMGL